MDEYKPRFDRRSVADWLAEAEHFERMAELFEANGQLSRGFRKLAADARSRAASIGR